MQGYQTQSTQQQQQQAAAVKTESQPSVLPGVNPPNPALENANGDEEMEVEPSEKQTKKPFWAKSGSKYKIVSYILVGSNFNQHLTH